MAREAELANIKARDKRQIMAKRLEIERRYDALIKQAEKEQD